MLPSAIGAARSTFGPRLNAAVCAPPDNQDYAEAVVPVAFQRGEMPGDWPQVTAVIISAPARGALNLASRLRRAIITDSTPPQDALSHLMSLMPERLWDLGQGRLHGDDNSVRRYLAVLRAEDETTPIGYCAFRLVHAPAELTVGLESFWIATARREMSLQRLLLSAVCDAAWRALLRIDRSTKPRHRNRLEVRFAASGRVGVTDSLLRDGAGQFRAWLSTLGDELCVIGVSAGTPHAR